MQNNLTHWDYAEEFSIEQIAALVVAQSEPPKHVLDRVLRAWNTAKTALFFKMVPSLQAIEGDALFSVQQLRFIRDFGQDAKAQPPLEDWQQARFTRPEIARWLRDTGLPSAYPFTPTETAQEQQATPPAPVQNALTTQEIASVFAGIGFTQGRWPHALSSTKYLEPARVRPGARGGLPALWNPFKVAQAIFLKEHRSSQGKLLEKLNQRFTSNKPLHPWGDEWESFYSIQTNKD